MAELEWRTNQLEQLLKHPELEAEETNWKDPGGGSSISTILHPKAPDLYWEKAIHNLGKYSYLAGTALALATLILVLISLVRHLEKLRKPQIILSVLSVALSLILIVDFSFNTYWFKDELFLLSNLFWIVPTGFVLFAVFSKRTASRKKQRLVIKNILAILLIPLTASACAYVTYVTAKGFFGVLAYFVGINLLSQTYLNLISRRSSEQVAVVSPPSYASVTVVDRSGR